VTIQLDHVIISARDRDGSAQLLAELLDVPHGAAPAGPFYAVYLNHGLTLDFIATDDPFPVEHFCFRVSEKEFDRILERIKSKGIAHRSTVQAAPDGKVNTDYGGRMVYWNEPEGHQWEMLTVSYARQPR
jgi:hypothetical protein